MQRDRLTLAPDGKKRGPRGWRVGCLHPVSLLVTLSLLSLAAARPGGAQACSLRLADVAHGDFGCEAVIGAIGPIASLGIDDGAEMAPVSPLGNPLQLADVSGFGVQVVTRTGAKRLSHADVLWLQAAFVDNDRRDAVPLDLPAIASPAHTPAQPLNPWAPAQPSDGLRLALGFLHYWLPNLRHSFFASLSLTEAPPMALRAYGDGASLATLGAGTRLAWSPANGVDLGLEVLYIGRGEFDRKRVGFMDIGVDGKVDARLRFKTDF